MAAGSDWSAVLHTTCGDVTLRLDGQRAPRSVASFVTLARAGYWTDSVCHRLTTPPAPTAFLQCGDPTGAARPNRATTCRWRTSRLTGPTASATSGWPAATASSAPPASSSSSTTTSRVARGAPVYSLIGHVDSGLDVVQHIASGGGEDFRSDGPPFLSISVLTVDVRRL